MRLGFRGMAFCAHHDQYSEHVNTKMLKCKLFDISFKLNAFGYVWKKEHGSSKEFGV